MTSKNELRKEKAKQSRDSLSDSYVINLLTKGTKLKASDIRKHPELIDCKRILIKTKRLIKKQENI